MADTKNKFQAKPLFTASGTAREPETFVWPTKDKPVFRPAPTSKDDLNAIPPAHGETRDGVLYIDPDRDYPDVGDFVEEEKLPDGRIKEKRMLPDGRVIPATYKPGTNRKIINAAFALELQNQTPQDENPGTGVPIRRIDFALSRQDRLNREYEGKGDKTLDLERIQAPRLEKDRRLLGAYDKALDAPKAALDGIIPNAAGVFGAGVGSPAGPGGSAVSAMAFSAAAKKAQEEFIKAIDPEGFKKSQQRMAAFAQDDPFLYGFASNAPGLLFNAPTAIIDDIPNRFASAGVGAVVAGGDSILHGEKPNLPAVLTGAGTNFLMHGRNTGAGEKLFRTGEGVAPGAARMFEAAKPLFREAGERFIDTVNPNAVFKNSVLTPQEFRQQVETGLPFHNEVPATREAALAMFGGDTEAADKFLSVLAATSQANTVKGNVTQTLNVYRQLKGGAESYSGGLAPVEANVNRALSGESLNGPKIGAFADALTGNYDSVVVDRHVARILYGVDKPTEAQIADAARIFRFGARKYDLNNAQVGQSLFAASKLAKGQNVVSYVPEFARRLNELSAALGIDPAAIPGTDSIFPGIRNDGTAGTTGVPTANGAGRAEGIPAGPANGYPGATENSGVPSGRGGGATPTGTGQPGVILGSGLGGLQSLSENPQVRANVSEGVKALGGWVTRPLTSESPLLADGTPSPGWTENLMTLRKAGLLTNPLTHIRNITANAGQQALDEIARIPASIADITRVAAARAADKAGNTNLARTFGTDRQFEGLDVVAIGRASKDAATKGFAEAREIVRTGKVANDVFDGETSLEKLEINREYASKSPLVNTLVNGVFRSLSAEDRVFRIGALSRSLSEQANLTARAEAQAMVKAGQTPPKDFLKTRAAELRQAPPDAMLATAISDAEEAVYGQSGGWGDKASDVAKAIRGIGQKPGETKFTPAAAALDAAMPFVKTPSNVLQRVMEYIHGGVTAPIKAGRQIQSDVKRLNRFDAAKTEAQTASENMANVRRSTGADTPESQERHFKAQTELRAAADDLANKAFTPEQQRQFAKTFGRGATGLALITLGSALANKGYITGYNVSKTDYGKREEEGAPEASIYIGGQWHDLNTIPGGNLLAMGASLREAVSREKDDDFSWWDATAAGTAQVFNQIGNAPILSTAGTINDLSEPGAVKRYVEGTAASFLPASAALGLAASIGDPNPKDTSKDGDYFKSRIPGLRNTLEDKPRFTPKSGGRLGPLNPVKSQAGPVHNPDLFGPKSGRSRPERRERPERPTR